METGGLKVGAETEGIHEEGAQGKWSPRQGIGGDGIRNSGGGRGREGGPRPVIEGET